MLVPSAQSKSVSIRVLNAFIKFASNCDLCGFRCCNATCKQKIMQPMLIEMLFTTNLDYSIGGRTSLRALSVLK